MAQGFDDFSTYDLNVEPPTSAWTKENDWTGCAVVVLEDSFSTLAPAGRRIRLSKGTTSTRCVLARADVPAVARCQMAAMVSVTDAYSSISGATTTGGLIGRVAGTSGADISGVGGFAGNPTSTNDATRTFRSFQYVNGTPGSIIDYTESIPAWVLNEPFWMVVDLNGTTVTTTIRTLAAPTVVVHSLVTTTTLEDAGKLGFFTFVRSSTINILAFGWGTDGDDAPMSALPAGPVAVAFTGTVPAQSLIADAAITPLDLSTYFAGDLTPFSYAVTTGTLPTGVTLNTTTGVISGTPTTAASAVSIVVTATDTGTNTAATNAFDVSVTNIALIWDFDSANIDPLVFTVENGETDTPTIRVKARLHTGDNISGAKFCHWAFGVTGVDGKRPIIVVDTTARNLTDTYASTWRPVWSQDAFSTWEMASAFTPLTVPTRVQFQPDVALTADTVYFADHALYQVARYQALAATLAADVSGLVTQSAAATTGGVIGTSPAETDDLGRAVGEHDIYGFVLGDDGATDDGHPKRWMIVDSGIHSGEVLDGWPLDGIVDFFLNGVGANADKLRANWKIGVYFCLTPNGRYGGHTRTNFRVTTDPNRAWGSFSLAEAVIVRDAMLADLGGSIPEVGISLHTAANAATTTQIYRSTAVPDQTKQNAWLAALDTADATTWSRVGTDIATSVSGWHAARGTPVVVIPEFGTRTTSSVARYTETGQRFLEATAIADADEVFYSGAPLPPAPIFTHYTDATPVFATTTSATRTIPADIAAGDVAVVSLFHRSTLTAPVDFTVAEYQNGANAQYTGVAYKVLELSDAGRVLTFSQSSSGRMALHLTIIRASSGTALVDQVGGTALGTNTVDAPSFTLAVPYCVVCTASMDISDNNASLGPLVNAASDPRWERLDTTSVLENRLTAVAGYYDNEVSPLLRWDRNSGVTTAMATAAVVVVSGAVGVTLSAPTVTAITATSATPRVTLTGAAAGTLHYSIYPSAASAPTFDGTTWSGTPVASGSEASNTVDGPQTFAAAATGLDGATPYHIAFAWTDGTDTSDVAWSEVWETLSAVVNATATGALAPISLTAPTASATATTVIDATASGTLSALSLTAPTASATVTTVIDATASGAVAAISLSAPTASATAGSVIDAAATGALAPISLSAPTGSASAGIVISATATGQIIGIRLDAPTGSASATANAQASGAIAALMLTAPTGSAFATQQADATASGAIAGISLTAPTGRAYEGDLGPLWLPRGTFWSVRYEDMTASVRYEDMTATVN